ncbi:unnamed protein product, partial [Menidia menidia]
LLLLLHLAGHKLCCTYGCSDSSDTRVLVTLDDDELCYADFKKEIGIWDSKIQTTTGNEWNYELAERYRLIEEVIEEEDNTLICFTNKFFPPEEVKMEDALIKSIANPDGTFHVFSYLNFIKKQGDVYSCPVELWRNL